jgi:CubicO group peptidase (beta-lactamase class C family)
MMHSNGTAADLGIMTGFPPPFDKRVTLANWDSPPFSRWSFQNVRSILPTRVIPRGPGPAKALPRAPQSLDELTYADLDGSRRTVGEMLATTYTDGFLLLRRGNVVVERYMNGMSETTPHLSQSVVKSFVGTLIGILVGQGLLSLDRPLSHYVPELAGTGYAGATLGQVLDMRSGVRFVEDYLDPASDVSLLDRVAGWKPPLPGEVLGGIYDLILTLRQERPHGGHFAYRSIETDALGWVLERATGRGLADLLSQELWQPLGAECDASIAIDRAGTCQADGGLNATLGDYARLGLLYLQEGAWGGRQILPAAWVAASRTGDRAAFAPFYGERFAAFPDAAYSRQWWVLDRQRGRHAAFGIFGQMILIDPMREMVAVKLSSWPLPLDDAMRLSTLRAIDAMADALG